MRGPLHPSNDRNSTEKIPGRNDDKRGRFGAPEMRREVTLTARHSAVDKIAQEIANSLYTDLGGTKSGRLISLWFPLDRRELRSPTAGHWDVLIGPTSN